MVLPLPGKLIDTVVAGKPQPEPGLPSGYRREILKTLDHLIIYIYSSKTEATGLQIARLINICKGLPVTGEVHWRGTQLLQPFLYPALSAFKVSL